jgi:hypothetical protein
LCRRLARGLFTRRRPLCRHVPVNQLLRGPVSRSPAVPLLGVQFQASRFFSVRGPQVDLRARARLCVLANADLCIPREPAQQDRDRLVSAPDCLRPDQRVPEAVPAVHRAGPVNAMFRVG